MIRTYKSDNEAIEISIDLGRIIRDSLYTLAAVAVIFGFGVAYGWASLGHAAANGTCVVNEKGIDCYFFGRP